MAGEATDGAAPLGGGALLIRDRAELRRRLDEHRERGERIVLTNGAFDIVHVGHVRCLLDAKSHGDVLVVALNSDASVRAYKGEGRPIHPELERAEVIAAVRGVDYVTIFDETTADAILEALAPDVHAKGRDYNAADGEQTEEGTELDRRGHKSKPVPELETARRLGIEVAIVGDPKDHSTSWIIEKMKPPGG